MLPEMSPLPQSLPPAQDMQSDQMLPSSSSSRVPSDTPNQQVNMGASAQGRRQCKFPNCTKPCFVEGDRVHEFCGKTHAKQYTAVSTSE